MTGGQGVTQSPTALSPVSTMNEKTPAAGTVSGQGSTDSKASNVVVPVSATSSKGEKGPLAN